MNSSRTLGLFLLMPAIILVVMLFFIPVILTGVFSFTNMSTATGITGGAYQVTSTVLQKLTDINKRPELAEIIGQTQYIIDEKSLIQLEGNGIDKGVIAELRQEHSGEIFDKKRAAESMIKGLDSRPGSTRDIKKISKLLNRSIINQRFETEAQLRDGLVEMDVGLTPEQTTIVVQAAYTGWTWTGGNFKRLIFAPDTKQVLINTAIYVAVTLVLFNTTFAMVLAVSTYYMPPRPAGIFRAIWLLPRISPPVIYVLMWKWLAWDSGFLSLFLSNFGIASRNWLLDTTLNAWVFVIVINGFVGASMGMIIFSSAIRAIPQQLFYASEVDGVSRWQQIRHVILPQLRWPILFITTYQTLSLMTSFDLILLSTRGGPGGTTEVWALATYFTALNNFSGNLQYGLGAAMALALVVIGVSMSLIYLRFFNYNALVTKPLIEQ